VRDIYRIIKKDDIQVLRTHQYHANLYGRIAGILAGVPAIIPSFHSRYRSPDKPKLHRRVINHLLSHFSDTLVAVSETVASDIVKYDRISREKIVVNYNGVDTEMFNQGISKEEARAYFNLPLDRILVGTLGRLKEEKGHEYLIRAAAGLQDVTVVIAGDGPLAEYLENLSVELGVNCIFTGRISPDNVPKFLHALDIFCFPSLWEGFATTLIEAMSSGLPTIASDIGSVNEIIEDKNYLVPAGSAVELTEKIDAMIKDADFREKAREKMVEYAGRFSIDRTVDNYENLFIACMKRKERV
jgi:glycosyltransferase involved in cell wall biosynthesis